MIAPWQVQRLGSADISLARAMNSLFAEAFEDAESYAAVPPDDSYFANLLAKPEPIAIVAVADGNVIGALTAYTLPKFEQMRSEIYIYDLAVREDWRRHGVATALIAAVETVARETDGWAVFVQADYGDDAAVALYTKLGTREDVMHFDLLPTPLKGD